MKARIKNAVKCKPAKAWVIAVSTAAVLAAGILIFVNSKWNLVISLEEKETYSSNAKEPEFENQSPEEEKVNLPEEKIYLPAEKIVYSEPITSGADNSKTEHNYYASETEGPIMSRR